MGSSGRNTRWKDVWNCINGFTSEFWRKRKGYNLFWHDRNGRSQIGVCMGERR